MKFIWVLLVLNIYNKVFAQNIPNYYKKTIVFLYKISSTGEPQASGTGFFVGVLAQKDSSLFGYLVTAKHVISNEKGSGFCKTIQIRYNKINKTYGTHDYNLIASGRAQNVFVHDDLSVDLAVIPFILDGADVTYSLDRELFKSKTDMDTSYVMEGTNLFYTGMFSPYLGYKKNSPITRFGRVSLLPDEKILFDSTEEKAELFLAETTTFGGNSGSPVFSYGSSYKLHNGDSSDPVNFREQNNVPIYLVGVIKGYYGEDSPIQFRKTSVMTPTYSSNIGVTAITPSYLLYQILNNPTLIKKRQDALK